MTFKVVIPARYQSTRLPGKMLMDIGGKPMIQRVYDIAVNSGAESVVIATDDARIYDVANNFGAAVCMTSPDHISGTDRIAEAVVALGYTEEDIIVNVQGDEPLLPPILIRQVAEDLVKFENAKVATLYESLQTTEDLFDANKVKVVMNKRGYALYFSRAPIAWERESITLPLTEHHALVTPHFRHVGLYAYRVKFLQEFTEWGPCELEQIEQLEQLRVLWNTGRVHVSLAKTAVPIDVNTQADLAVIRTLLNI